MMRKLLLLSLLTACELQPAPPKPAPSETATAGSGSATAPTGDPNRISAPRPTAPSIQPTAECEQAGIKLADLMIEGADPSQKPAFEVDRANIVRRTEVACTQQQWTRPALSCIAQSRSDAQARACLEKFPSQTTVPPPAGSAAAGSAAGSAAPARSAAGSAAGSAAPDPRLKDHPPAKGEHPHH
jgi:hypothetical protein